MSAMQHRFWAGFPEKLQAARHRAGYSQNAMEMQLHLGQHVFSKWERGYRHPGWLALRRVCLMLGIDPASLFPELDRWHPTGAALASRIALRDLSSVPDGSRLAEWSPAPVARREDV